MASDTFDIIFLIARPAAGKSEIIDYLKRTGEDVRRDRFHVGAFCELDDFPMLWTWFEEDEILTRMSKPRLHTDEQGYFTRQYLWHVLIERLALDYAKLVRDHPSDRPGPTAVIEFSRGREHGGFREAFRHFPASMLTRGAILYVDVSWEESRRKNRRRFNPERPDSILEHGLSGDKLERLYRESDWDELSAGDPQFITVDGIAVPYAVFPNEDDVTTPRGPALGDRLQDTLGRLWDLYAGGRL